MGVEERVRGEVEVRVGEWVRVPAGVEERVWTELGVGVVVVVGVGTRARTQLRI